jgi:GNAT superfamily N-acetyltransferase
MEYQFSSFSDRPEKISEVLHFTESIRSHSNPSDFGWPTFEFQSSSGKAYWTRLHQDFRKYQFLLSLDDRVIASCFAIPFYWQGSKEDLPEGWDKVIEKGFADRENGISANALSLLAITVSPEHQGRGISKLILHKVQDYVNKYQLQYLVAPVRPVLKQFYPLAPIFEYAEWKTKEGKIFDPWLRVHLSMGASLVKFAPQSLTIEGSIADWENWTGMKFPASGDYVIPGALSTVAVSVEKNKATYYQPNIWLQHDLARANTPNNRLALA